MCLEFVDSFGLCNKFGEFTAMWWNKMTGSGSGQIREPPRFFGLYFSQLFQTARLRWFLHFAAREGKQTKSNFPTGVYREEGINNMGQHLRTRQRRLLRRRVLRAAQFVTQTSHDVSPFAFDLL